MTVQIIRGDARALPLADNTVDLVVTSPPYFALRSYTDAGAHYGGQIGSEGTPAEWLTALLEVTAECVRVLKPSGSLFVNLGDKYSGAQAQNVNGVNRAGDSARTWAQTNPRSTGIPNKSLMGLPARYMLACIDQLGLILRAEIIWNKPNGLPESVTDRVRRSHEQWFHFTQLPRYYSAVDEIRELTTPTGGGPPSSKWAASRDEGVRGWGPANSERTHNPLGKLPGSVWTVPSEPLTVPPELGVDHFAAFPLEWPRRIIRGWSPTGVCSDCGFLLGSSYDSGLLGVRKGLRAVAAQGSAEDVLRQSMCEPEHGEEQSQHDLPSADDSWIRRTVEAGSPDGAEEWLSDGAPLPNGRAHRALSMAGRGCPPQERDQDRQPNRESRTAREDRARQAAEARAQALRLPSLRRPDSELRQPLACPHCGGSSFRPSVIADPFGGTGTTALAALALGRDAIHVDLSADYNRIATWRCTDRDQLAKAMQVTRPESARDADLFDMDSLFEGIG